MVDFVVVILTMGLHSHESKGMELEHWVHLMITVVLRLFVTDILKLHILLTRHCSE